MSPSTVIVLLSVCLRPSSLAHSLSMSLPSCMLGSVILGCPREPADIRGALGLVSPPEPGKTHALSTGILGLAECGVKWAGGIGWGHFSDARRMSNSGSLSVVSGLNL